MRKLEGILNSVRSMLFSRDVLTYSAILTLGTIGIGCNGERIPKIHEPGLVGIVTLDLEKYAARAIYNKNPNELAGVIRSYIAVGDVQSAERYLFPLLELNRSIGLSVAREIQDYIDAH